MGRLHLLRRLRDLFGLAGPAHVADPDAVPDSAFVWNDAPAGHVRWRPPPRTPAGRSLAVGELAQELICRIEEGHGLGTNDYLASLGSRLQHALQQDLDVHANPFSNRKLADLFALLYRLVPVKPPIRDATIVELGPGSANPFGLLFVFLMLGAKRGIAVDHDEVQDVGVACRAIAATAAAMVLDPSCVLADYAITPRELLENIASFDLAKLRGGDPGGLDGGRLTLLHDAVEHLPLPDGAADVVLSNAFLEHVLRVDDSFRELARITRPGGIHVHHIDVSDHVRYTSKQTHALDFLRMREPFADGLYNASNRLRVPQLRELFERHGLEVLDCRIAFDVPVTDELRASFVEPFRSMTNDDLRPTAVVFLARKR